jgi:phage terminase large subunit
MKFVQLPHQKDFIKDESRYLLNSGGVGSGKTYSIVLKALKLITKFPGIFGLIGAQTYPLLRDTTLREFINVVPSEIIKSYNKSLQHFTFYNGSELIFRPFDDANKLKSLNLGFAGIEEMTDVHEDIFKMLRTRMRQKGMPGCIFGATNPGTFGNWVYKYFIESPIVNSKVIYSISAFNKFLPEEYLKDLETLQKTNPEYYERMVMGKWGSLEGVIYNLPIKQRIKELPDKKKIHRWIAGLDFGFQHPTAFIIIGIRENIYYVYEEIYQRQLTSGDIIKIILDKMQDYEIDSIYCDSARPEIIEDLQRNQIPAIEAVKDVFDGIMHVKSLIGSEQLFVSQDCNYTLREFDSYIWDAKNEVKEVPVKVNDDCFIGKHKVLTLRGNIKLSKLKKTDLIYTRNGFKKIIKLYKKEKEVNKYKFNNKNVFDLTNKDILYILNIEEYKKCQNQKLLNLMELNLEDGRNQNIQIIESITPVIAIILKWAFVHCIGKSGNLYTEKFQKAIKYIIKTIIHLIIKLKIWNVSKQISIYQIMQKNGIKSIRQKIKFILIQFAIKLLLGIVHKRVKNGIQNMAKKYLEKWVTLLLNAPFVEWYLKQKKIKKTILDSVLTIASQDLEENRAKIILLSNVLNVEKNFIRINIEKGYTVQNIVVKKHIGKTKREMTYNLTVDEQPEYYVDRILVHNCMDAIRYALYTDNKNMVNATFEFEGDRESIKGW